MSQFHALTVGCHGDVLCGSGNVLCSWQLSCNIFKHWLIFFFFLSLAVVIRSSCLFFVQTPLKPRCPPPLSASPSVGHWPMSPLQRKYKIRLASFTQWRHEVRRWGPSVQVGGEAIRTILAFWHGDQHIWAQLAEALKAQILPLVKQVKHALRCRCQHYWFYN